MARLSGGCDMARRAAARPKCSSSATAMKYRASRTSTIDSLSLSVWVENGPSSIDPAVCTGCDDRAPHRPSPSGRPERHAGYRTGEAGYRRISIALFAAGVATFALIYSTQALLPDFTRTFSVSAAQSTLSVSLTTIGLGVTLLIAGPVSEVVGRTRLIHFSLAASAVVAVACALAPTWDVLLGLRLLEGVTLAGLPAVATAYLREELHPSTHARAAGLYIGGTAIGGMAGRLVTGPIAEVADWRWALAAIAAVGLAAPSSCGCSCRPRGTSSRRPHESVTSPPWPARGR